MSMFWELFFYTVIQGSFTKTSLVNLLNKCYDRFSVSLNFDPVQKILRKYDVRFKF